MPRVHTQKAGKDYPDIGVKKGDTYYWWKFRYGGKRKSKSYPKPQQLTQSDFLQQVYDINDEIGDLEWSEDLQVSIDEIIERVTELRDEQEEKRSNMPEQLQEVGTGEMLQNRMDSLDEMIDELESVDPDIEEEEWHEIHDDINEERRNGGIE